MNAVVTLTGSAAFLSQFRQSCRKPQVYDDVDNPTRHVPVIQVRLPGRMSRLAIHARTHEPARYSDCGDPSTAAIDAGVMRPSLAGRSASVPIQFRRVAGDGGRGIVAVPCGEDSTGRYAPANSAAEAGNVQIRPHHQLFHPGLAHPVTRVPPR